MRAGGCLDIAARGEPPSGRSSWTHPPPTRHRPDYLCTFGRNRQNAGSRWIPCNTRAGVTPYGSPKSVRLDPSPHVGLGRCAKIMALNLSIPNRNVEVRAMTSQTFDVGHESLAEILAAVTESRLADFMGEPWSPREADELSPIVQVAGPSVLVDGTPVPLDGLPEGVGYPSGRSGLPPNQTGSKRGWKWPRPERDWRDNQGDAPFPDESDGDGNATRAVEIDRLAWYISFRHQPIWGIFIRRRGVDRVAHELQAAGNLDAIACLGAAWDFLLAHELAHFQLDLMVLGIEIASGSPIYLEGKRRQKLKSPGYGLAEEGLANSIARSGLPAYNKSALDPWLRRSPEGYRDFKDHKASSRGASWAAAIGDLSTRYLPFVYPPSTKPPPFRSDVPIFFVDDQPRPRLPVRRATYFALFGSPPVSFTVTETEGFKRDLKTLTKGRGSAIMESWTDLRRSLETGNINGGARLKPIKGVAQAKEARLNSGDRVGFLHDRPATLNAIAAGKHDDLVRRVRRIT